MHVDLLQSPLYDILQSCRCTSSIKLLQQMAMVWVDMRRHVSEILCKYFALLSLARVNSRRAEFVLGL